MKCKHCQKKVFSLHGGYCGSCKRNLSTFDPDQKKTTSQNQALDNFSTQMLNSAINGINEAVAQERKKAIIKIQDANLDLTQFKCRSCEQKFTVNDIKKDNWEAFFAKKNGQKLTKFRPINEWGRGILGFEIKCFFHRQFDAGGFDCPEVERCQGCYEKFSTPQLKEKEDYYWCKSCQPTAGFTEKKETGHA